jgi:hypothetical protein
MNNVTQFKPVTFVSDSEIVLKAAMEENFKTVMVFGFDGETVSIMASQNHSNLELIGALEAAKQELWLSTYDG